MYNLEIPDSSKWSTKLLNYLKARDKNRSTNKATFITSSHSAANTGLYQNFYKLRIDELGEADS